MSYNLPFHVHSNLSQRDGVPSPEQVVVNMKEKGYTGCMLTDHGTLGGQNQLWEACQKHGLKPNIGIEFYFILDKFANLKSNDKTSSTGLMMQYGDNLGKEIKDNKTYHLTCVCLNETGYKNLLKIIYISNLKQNDGIKVDGYEGYFQKVPRVTEKLVFQYQEGLAFTSGCRLSIFNEFLCNKKETEAKFLLKMFQNNVENFFIELHIAHNEVEENLFYLMKDFAFRENIPVLIANDSHYLNKGDLKKWHMLSNLRRNKTISTKENILNDDFYIKDKNEVIDRVNELTNNNMSDLIKIMEGHDILEEKLNFTWENHKVPKIQIPDAEVRLKRLLDNSLLSLFGNNKEYQDRIENEFDVAKFTGNCSYYLLVYELIKWCKKNGITTPINRGSAGGLLMLYLLGITKVNPIEYGLIAERASNKQRMKEMDIDLDFSPNDALKVIQYLKDTYGEKCICNIINYGVNKMSSSIRHSLKYLEVAEFTKNKISKEIKKKFVEMKYSGDEQVEIEKDITNIMNNEEFQNIFKDNGLNYNDVLEKALWMEGTVNNYSVHASGILISNKHIYEQFPTYRVNDKICCAFDMNDLNNIGALKLDILRVKAYGKMDDAVKMYNDSLNM